MNQVGQVVELCGAQEWDKFGSDIMRSGSFGYMHPGDDCHQWYQKPVCYCGVVKLDAADVFAISYLIEPLNLRFSCAPWQLISKYGVGVSEICEDLKQYYVAGIGHITPATYSTVLNGLGIVPLALRPFGTEWGESQLRDHRSLQTLQRLIRGGRFVHNKEPFLRASGLTTRLAMEHDKPPTLVSDGAINFFPLATLLIAAGYAAK
jgi:hypothetical protein